MAGTSHDTKAYLAQRNIPQLFESLMTGLMYNRPTDHVSFLIECLSRVQDKQVNDVLWDAFVTPRNESPLPAIKREASNLVEASVRRSHNYGASPTLNKSMPLPPIGQSKAMVDQSSAATDDACVSDIPIPSPRQKDSPVIFVTGGPASGKLTQCRTLMENNKSANWVYLSMAGLVHREVYTGGPLAPQWKKVEELLSQGKHGPQEALAKLLKMSLEMYPNASGFLIAGFLQTMGQVREYEKLGGRVGGVILLECEEGTCQSRLMRKVNLMPGGTTHPAGKKKLEAGSSLLLLFKKFTLPVLKYYQDQGKLSLVDGDKTPYEVSLAFGNLVTQAFRGDGKSSNALEGSGDWESRVVDSAGPQIADTGRKPGFTKAPIILFIGGPGSGKRYQCERLAQKFPSFEHISMDNLSTPTQAKDLTSELVADEIRSKQDGKAFLVEGYPRSEEQINTFNTLVGGASLAILLDCEERHLVTNLVNRAKGFDDPESVNAARKRVSYFKEKTLPVANYFDDLGKLVVVNGDKKEDEVFLELTGLVEKMFYSTEQVSESSDKKEDAVSDAPLETAAPEVEEATTVAAPEEGEAAAAATAEAAPEEAEAVTAEKQQGEETVEHEEQEVTKSDMAPLKEKTVVFVVGGPGCGKGTQCAKIVDKFGFCHLSSGDLLRAEVASGSDRGRDLNAIMESGQLVSLDIVLTLIKEAMAANSSAKGFLIDGYPRELEQGTRFENEICPPQHVLYFEVSDDTMKSRLLERAKTSGRVDDNEETIAKRLATFHQHTQAVIEHYDKTGLLRRLEASGTPDAIFDMVVPVLSS